MSYKFRDNETGETLTLADLEREYKQLKAAGQTEAEDFSDYVINCREKNGSIDLIASDDAIKEKREDSARRVADMTGYNYHDVIKLFNELGIHSTWTSYELYHRPVDYDELAEMVSEEFG